METNTYQRHSDEGLLIQLLYPWIQIVLERRISKKNQCEYFVDAVFKMANMLKKLRFEIRQAHASARGRQTHDINV